MGCDIHMGVEVRKGQFWVPAFQFYECPDCNGIGVMMRGEYRCDWCSGTGKQSGYAERNYTVFAILADVRNDKAITPIATPRGLPVDSTFHDDNLGGDHTSSWLTLAELLGYDWAAHAGSAGNFHSKFMPSLEQLARDRAVGPDGVRIVFNFDN